MPVFDIINIMLDALMNGCITPKTVNLCPSGHSRFNLMFDHVFWNIFFKLFYKKRSFRTGTHQTHLALHYIKQLWYFIQTGFSKEISEFRLSWITLSCPLSLFFFR